MARISARPRGVISLDRGGTRARQRRVYLPRSRMPGEKAMKANLLAKAFECPVEREVYEQLMDALSEGADAPEAKQ